MRIVESPHDHLLWPSPSERIGHVGKKRGISAGMVGDARAVHPDGRLVIHRTKVKQQPFAGAKRRRVEGAPIPAGAVEAGVANTAGGRLGRERHANGVRPDR